MSLRRRLALASFALVAAPLACKGGGGPGAAALDPDLAAIDARIPSRAAAPISVRAGFIRDGVAYVALRPDRLLDWARSLPVPPDAARELADASGELGVDLRSGDVLGYFGLDPAGVVTMTLARPLLRDSDGLFEGIARRPPLKGEAFPGAEEDPLPPALTQRLSAVIIHSRIHVPTSDSAKIPALIRDKVKPNKTNLADPLCRDLGAAFCFGDTSALVIARSEAAALVVDVFNFPAAGDYTGSERSESIKAALAAPPAELAVLGALDGDFVVYVDAPIMPILATATTLGDLTRSARYLDQESLLEEIERRRRTLVGLEKIRSTRRLLRGARLEASVTGGDLRATFAWEPMDAAAGEALDRLLSHRGAPLSVPTLAGLCDGALSCFRMTGLPSLADLGEIATGTYAGPASDFSEAMSMGDELAGLALFLETWPNLLGASHRWVKEELRGPEGAIFNGVLDSISRFEGAGASIRGLKIDPMKDPTGEYITYLRAATPEINLIRGLTGFGGVRFEPLEVAGVDAKIERARLPDADLPLAVLAATDPTKVKSADQDLEVGWLALADAPERLTWLLGLPRETVVRPAFYYEVDLSRISASIPDIERELGGARAWLDARTARVSFTVIAGRPRFDLFVGKSPAAR